MGSKAVSFFYFLVDNNNVIAILADMDLKQARFDANRMTQAQLSLKTKIDTSRISRFENGTASPNTKQKKSIARALKTKNIEYIIIQSV